MTLKPDLNTLYRKHAPSLLAIFMRYVSDRASAEDILQEVFLAAGDNLGTFRFRSDASTFAWLKKIGVNKSLEYLRKRKRSPEVLEDPPDTIEESAPEAGTIEKIPLSKLLEFISELPDGYRTVFNLFCLDGYSHSEIAQMLGIREKSSSSQYLRARQMLAARIIRYAEEEK